MNAAPSWLRMRGRPRLADRRSLLATAIEQRRRDQRVTLAELADRMEVDISTVSRWCDGGIELSVRHLVRLMAVLELDEEGQLRWLALAGEDLATGL